MSERPIMKEKGQKSKVLKKTETKVPKVEKKEEKKTTETKTDKKRNKNKKRNC